MAEYTEELKLTIFKILKEAHKWYRDDFIEGEKITGIRRGGSLPVWQYKNRILEVYLEAPHCIHASVSFEVKSGELCYTDLTFVIAPEVINEYEILEGLLIQLVSLYAKYKVKRDELQD